MASRRDIEAGRAHVRLWVKDTEFQKGLKRARSRINRFARDVQQIGRVMTVAGGAVTAAIGTALKGFSSFGDSLNKMSARTGVSVEALSELRFAAEQSGADLESLDGVLERLNRRFGRVTAGQGTANQVSALQELGLSIEQLRGLDAEGRFLAIADAMQRYGDQAAAAGLAQRVLGTGVDRLLPLIAAGRDGIEALRKEARDLGIVMSTEDAQAAADFSDAWNRMSKLIENAWHRVGAAVAPAVEDMVERVSEVIREYQSWIDANQEIIVKALAIGSALTVAGGAFMAIAGVASGASAALLVVSKSIAAVGAMATYFAANPATLAIAALGALVALTYRYQTAASRMGDELTRLRQREDEARAGHLSMMQELEGLADKQSLTSDEMNRAESIVKTLGMAYGNLGVEIDHTTGTISGMAGAWENLNAKMKAATISQLEAEATKLEAKLEGLERQGESFIPMLVSTAFGDAGRTLAADIRSTYMEISALEDRIAALKSGDSSEAAFTGGASATGIPKPDFGTGVEVDSDRIRRAKEMEQALIDRTSELRIQAIEDEQERAVAAVNARYDEEIRRAEELGATLYSVEIARNQALSNIADEFDRRRADEAAREQEMRDASTQRVRDETERLKIEMSTTDEKERQKRLLEFDRQLALRDSGADPAAVNALFDIRKKALDQASRFDFTPAAAMASGTFSTSAALAQAGGGSGSTAERTARGVERVAKSNDAVATAMGTLIGLTGEQITTLKSRLGFS